MELSLATDHFATVFAADLPDAVTVVAAGKVKVKLAATKVGRGKVKVVAAFSNRKGKKAVTVTK